MADVITVTGTAPATGGPRGGEGVAAGQAAAALALAHPPPPPLPPLSPPPGITFGPITPGPVLDQLKSLNAALFPVKYQVCVCVCVCVCV